MLKNIIILIVGMLMGFALALILLGLKIFNDKD